jgi:ribosome-binding factor A
MDKKAMPKEFSRTRRVSELIQRELADLIRENIRTSGLITVSSVKISPDLQQATIYVTVLGGDKSEVDTVKHLQNQVGILRHGLSQRLNLRVTPRLHFLYDESLEYASKINALLHQANLSSSDS